MRIGKDKQAMLEEWKRVYEAAEEIAGTMPPSEYETPLIVDDGNTDWHIRFFVWNGKKGIGCYPGGEAYRQAMDRLYSENTRKEPVFSLQDGYIGMWEDRDSLSRPARRLLRELEKSYRGKGSWLSFRKYRQGYWPVLPQESEAAELAAVLEGAAAIVRGERESDLPRPPKKTVYARLTAPDTPRLATVRRLPMSQHELVMDMAFVGRAVQMKGQKFFWQVLLGVCDGEVVRACRIEPAGDYRAACMTVLQEFCVTYGRPRTVVLASEMLLAAMEEALFKMGISIRVVPALPELDRFFSEISGGAVAKENEG